MKLTPTAIINSINQRKENSRFQMVGKAGTSLIPKEQLTTFNRCYLATETYFFFVYIFLYVCSFPGLSKA
jgi:hypothetical protein